MYIAEVSQITPDDLEKLFYNGFDNPESIEMCSIADLQQLNVFEPEIVLQRLQLSLKAYREQGPINQEAEVNNTQNGVEIFNTAAYDNEEEL